jgi:hypothetical protein
MSLKISSFYSPEAQNFVFRNACFPILVDLAAYRCLKNYAHAPIYSTLAGFFTVAVVAYHSPLPLQLLGGGVYLAYKATSFMISYFTTPKIQTKQSWDDITIFAAINTILPIIEESKIIEGLYITPGPHAKISSLAKDPGKSTLSDLLNADANTLAGLVKELLKRMDPPLLTNAKDQFKEAASLQSEPQKVQIKLAVKLLSPKRAEIFLLLIRHLHKIANRQSDPPKVMATFAQLFSQSFADPNLTPIIKFLIQNPNTLQ